MMSAVCGSRAISLMCWSRPTLPRSAFESVARLIIMLPLAYGASVAAWQWSCMPSVDGTGRATPHELHRT